MDAGHINIGYVALMADRRSLSFICCLLCLLINTKNLVVDATDNNPLRHGTCSVEEGEDGFCDSGDENMYVENVDISDLKDAGASLQNKEEVESFSEDLPVEKTSNGLFDSKHENMYRENVDVSDLKDAGASLQNKEEVESFSEDSPVEKRSNSLFDNKQENMHRENDDVSVFKDAGASLQNKDDVEISSEGSPAETPSTGDDNSLLEVSDKQFHVINNSTNEWLGLQIPVVDGVRVSDSFSLPVFF